MAVSTKKIGNPVYCEGNPVEATHVADNEAALQNYINKGLAYNGLLCYNLEQRAFYFYDVRNGGFTKLMSDNNTAVQSVTVDGSNYISINLANGQVIKSSTNISDKDTYYVTSVNGQAEKVGIYAPSSSGSKGQILVAEGTNQAPVWKTVTDVVPEVDLSIDEGTL